MAAVREAEVVFAEQAVQKLEQDEIARMEAEAMTKRLTRRWKDFTKGQRQRERELVEAITARRQALDKLKEIMPIVELEVEARRHQMEESSAKQGGGKGLQITQDMSLGELKVALRKLALDCPRAPESLAAVRGGAKASRRKPGSPLKALGGEEEENPRKRNREATLGDALVSSLRMAAAAEEQPDGGSGGSSKPTSAWPPVRDLGDIWWAATEVEACSEMFSDLMAPPRASQLMEEQQQEEARLLEQGASLGGGGGGQRAMFAEEDGSEQGASFGGGGGQRAMFAEEDGSEQDDFSFDGGADNMMMDGDSDTHKPGGITGWGLVPPSMRLGEAMSDAARSAAHNAQLIIGAKQRAAAASRGEDEVEKARLAERSAARLGITRDIAKARSRRDQVHAATDELLEELEKVTYRLRRMREERDEYLMYAFDLCMMAVAKYNAAQKKKGSKRGTDSDAGASQKAGSKSNAPRGAPYGDPASFPEPPPPDGVSGTLPEEASSMSLPKYRFGVIPTVTGHPSTSEALNGHLSISELSDWMKTAKAVHKVVDPIFVEALDPWAALIRRYRQRVRVVRGESESLRAAAASAQILGPSRMTADPDRQQALARIEKRTKRLLSLIEGGAGRALESVEAWATWAASFEGTVMVAAGSSPSEDAPRQSLLAMPSEPFEGGVARLRIILEDLIRAVNEEPLQGAPTALDASSVGSIGQLEAVAEVPDPPSLELGAGDLQTAPSIDEPVTVAGSVVADECGSAAASMPSSADGQSIHSRGSGEVVDGGPASFSRDVSTAQGMEAFSRRGSAIDPQRQTSMAEAYSRRVSTGDPSTARQGSKDKASVSPNTERPGRL